MSIGSATSAFIPIKNNRYQTQQTASRKETSPLVELCGYISNDNSPSETDSLAFSDISITVINPIAISCIQELMEQASGEDFFKKAVKSQYALTNNSDFWTQDRETQVDYLCKEYTHKLKKAIFTKCTDTNRSFNEDDSDFVSSKIRSIIEVKFKGYSEQYLSRLSSNYKH